ncbi:ComEC/Rec2 family competence protein [Baekduia sp.]|uniref:ComEC/Rec2 family competence protein n=1 Tax=Baekduia sp. TaxID=2600305 RepID=UPI002D1FA6AF|nr:ComEC/Rec2 family competence protein [Baekduia sp.]
MGLAEVAGRHVRHVVLATIVAGLALGPWAPASVIAVVALGVAVGAITVPLVRSPVVAVALAAVLIAAAMAAEARTATLERTALTPDFGHAVTGDATVLTPSRAEAFGGRRALVRWRGEPVLLRMPAWSASASATPAVGEVVRVRGSLRAPDPTARIVHAHATLRATHVVDTGRRRGGALGVVDGVRRRAEASLRGHLPAPEAALLRGMVLGDDSALPEDLRDAFQAASLTHLTAASGQNIMLLAALALGLSMVVGLGVRARWLLVLALIALYVPLAGGGPSIQRAGIMGAATIAAALAGRPASRWYALLLAAAVTLALDPRALAEPGWQLSFAAVVGIVVLAPATRARLVRARMPAPVAEAVAVTLAATLATAPLIAARFDRASLVALPANVLATPAVAPVMWLGMAAAAIGQVVPGLAGPLVMVAGLPVGYLVALGRTAAAFPGAQVALPLAVVVILSALAAVLVTAPPARERLAGPRNARRRRLGVVAATGLALAAAIGPMLIGRRAVAPPPAGDLRITALNVGQGDATLLQAGGRAILVDAGPAGAGVVRELRAAGVSRLDVLVVTHPQADHDGGAPAVLSALPVDVLLDGRGEDRSPTSVALDAPLRRRATRVVAAAAGQVLRVGPLTLRVLWPPAGPAAPGGDPNERAIVGLAGAYGASALLTADAESPQIAPLELAPVDVLKVSHHGSADPGLPGLLERLRPRVALVEAGRGNTYGHPAPETMAVLAGSVPVVRRTDQDGAVRVDVRGGAATVTAAGAGRNAAGGGRGAGV